MKCSMLVFDLDETLLDDKGTISEYARNILCQIKIRKVIATNRCLNNTGNIAKTIGASSIVFSNGAGILDNDTITYHFLKWGKIGNLIKEIMIKDDRAKISVRTKEKVYCNYYDSTFIKADFRKFNRNDILKVTIESDDIIRLFRIIFKYDGINCSRIGKSQIAITSDSADKLKGVMSLAKKYDIKPDEIIAFGDDYNDIPLFKVFKNSVAVMNAKMELKEYASDMCLDNKRDGVARWIDKNILNNRIKTIVKQGSSSVIEIDYKNKIVTKKVPIKDEGISNGYTKLFYEMKHMMEFNKKYFEMYPKVYEIVDTENYLKCKIEYLYDGITFSDIIKDERISFRYLKNSIEFVLNKLFGTFYISKNGIVPNKNYILDNYIDRVSKRLKMAMEMVLNDCNYDILIEIIKNGVILNGKKYLPYSQYIEYLKNDLNFIKKLEIGFNTESHHDLIPTNIIVDYNKRNDRIVDFKLIDPRGELETGSDNRHFMYDIGKFLFGLNGFDLIRMKFDERKDDIYHYQVLGKKDDIYRINFNFNSANQIVKRYKYVYEQVYDDFKKNKYNYFNSINVILNYEMMFKFAETCNFIADIPCRINNNNNAEIAICFYLRGLELMGDFIKLVYGRDLLEGKC